MNKIELRQLPCGSLLKTARGAEEPKEEENVRIQCEKKGNDVITECGWDG